MKYFTTVKISIQKFIQPRNLKVLMLSLWRSIVAVIDRAEHHHIFLAASGIAFNIVLFILPTLLAVLYGMSLFSTDNTAVLLKQILVSVLPDGGLSEEMATLLINETTLSLSHIASVGWISVPLLFWTASTLFASLRTALNAVFGISEPGFFLKYKLKDIGLLLLFTLVILLSGIFSAFLAVFKAVGAAVRDNFFFFIPVIFDTVFGLAISLSISFFFFVFLYVYVPHKKLPIGLASSSAAICAILWEAARALYSWYIADIGSFGKLYGTYSFLAISALWIYYAALVVLISAEIADFIWRKYVVNSKSA
jgi:membrane protein